MDEIVAFLSVSSAIKLLLTYLKCDQRPQKAEYVGKISELHLFPVKSMGGIQLKTAECTQRGMKYPYIQLFDRTFVVVDENGTFQHGRTFPKLTTVISELSGQHIILQCKGMSELCLPVHNNNTAATVVNTKIWSQPVQGRDCGDEAAEWISTCLNKPGLRLIHGSTELMCRQLNKSTFRWKKYQMTSKDDDVAIFHDAFPYMLMCQSSLDDLNEKSKEEFTMTRFRPNIVVSGCQPFDEDNWDEIWVGKCKFTNKKPCNRCILTCVDPETGILDKNEEPLSTLRKYRLDEANFQNSPLLGVQMVQDTKGACDINVGDPVYALRQQVGL